MPQLVEFTVLGPTTTGGIARFIRTSVSAEKHEVFPENEPYMPLEAQIYRSVLRLGTTGDSTTPWLFLPGVIAIL